MIRHNSPMPPGSDKYMERAAHLATVVGALVAAVALLVAVYEFTKTQRMARRNLELQMKTLLQDREIKAIELFLKFNEQQQEDRKSTRLNSSHVEISYAVFCLKKKKK